MSVIPLLAKSETAGDRITAQLFPPSADTWVRLVFTLGTLVLIGLAFGAFDYADSAYVTQVGWVEHQPIPFSHKHHVTDDGIDCRYCHTGVETSPNAGLPPTHTCMSCHSQLWNKADMLAPVRESLVIGKPIHWQRVAQLPDYVYFDHSIHVARGVPCVECHGRVDEMPLLQRAEPFQMQFCLDCHRDPSDRLRPPELVTQMEPLGWSEEDRRRYGRKVMAEHHIDPKVLDNCGICHR